MSDDQQQTQDTSTETPQVTSEAHTNDAPHPATQPPAPGQPAAPGVQPQDNPGQTLGIVSIVLGVLAIWVVGLPLAIVSLVKSSKAKASKTLGIVGLILNILSLLATLFFIFVVVVSIPYIAERAKELEATQAKIDAAYLIPLTMDYKPTNPDVAFSLPAAYYGWTETTTDRAGVTEFTKDDNSATFMTYQGTLSGMTGSDREMTQKAMADYIYQLEGVEVSNSESTYTFTCDSDGKMLQFETKQITATSDGRPIKGIVAVRMYEGHELSVIYLADADTFSLSTWSDMASQVTIDDGART